MALSGFGETAIVAFALFTAGVVSDGCRGSLNFQMAPTASYFYESHRIFESTPSSFPSYSNRSAFSVVHCADLCYDEATNFCNSALYEPHASVERGGQCQLSQRVLPCVSTTERRFRRQTVSDVDRRFHSDASVSQGRVLLFCFRCIETNTTRTNGSVPLATVTLPDLQLDNIANLNLTSVDEVPVEKPVHNEREFDSVLTPNVLIGNSKFKFVPLRVMTMNVWVAGTNVYNGINKIASHITHNDPDVVALQEMNLDAVDQLLRMLGPNWSSCRRSNGGGDFILTRHLIDEDHEPSSNLWNTGCRIKLLNHAKFINVWGIHLDWRDYGPYSACFNRPTSSEDLYQMLEFNEHKFQGRQTVYGRMNNIIHLMTHRPFAQNLGDTAEIPLILAGDFNAPSHLDWTDRMRVLHCNTSYEWPVSKILHESTFKDSYREVYPHPDQSTGYTWTPVHKMNPDDPMLRRIEPQDRIDFIYYRGNYIRPKSSQVYNGYSGTRLYPYHRMNDWPSDHAAVVTDFDLLLIE